MIDCCFCLGFVYFWHFLLRTMTTTTTTTIQNISDEKFEQLFEALPENEHLEVLSLTNVGLNDRTALDLAEAIEKNKTLRVLNVETNFISPAVIVVLVRALLKAKSIEEFRASNQVCHFPFINWLVCIHSLWLKKKTDERKDTCMQNSRV